MRVACWAVGHRLDTPFPNGSYLCRRCLSIVAPTAQVNWLALVVMSVVAGGVTALIASVIL